MYRFDRDWMVKLDVVNYVILVRTLDESNLGVPWKRYVMLFSMSPRGPYLERVL
jgi:hypothetical protein